MSVVQDVLSEMNKLKTPEKFDPHAYHPIENDPIEQNVSSHSLLRDCVRSVMANYIKDLEGHNVEDLYQLVLTEVETPLLETILEHTGGNQSKAAKMLGINRGTLRKKLKQYHIGE